MGTAPKKSRAAGQLARIARDVRAPEAMDFLMFEDNGDAHRWRIVAGDGARLAESESSASYDRAVQAARRVRARAASARFDRRGPELGAVALAARRDRPRDDLKLEPWLDDGGSFTREAEARWPDDR